MSLTIDQIQIGPMRNFVYLITYNRESFVIDPQPEIDPWCKKLDIYSANLRGILLTHTHHDHIGGIGNILKKFDVPIYVNKADTFRLKDEFKSKIKNINDSDKLFLGIDDNSIAVEVLHTPGHSIGESCFLIKENNQTHLFTGDTVFTGLVGRTDLETGSDEELFETIQRLKKLPSTTIFYPGHDYGKTPTTTLAQECIDSDAFRCNTLEEFKAIP